MEVLLMLPEPVITVIILLNPQLALRLTETDMVELS
jgi:hypothetical protein